MLVCFLSSCIDNANRLDQRKDVGLFLAGRKMCVRRSCVSGVDRISAMPGVASVLGLGGVGATLLILLRISGSHNHDVCSNKTVQAAGVEFDERSLSNTSSRCFHLLSSIAVVAVCWLAALVRL